MHHPGPDGICPHCEATGLDAVPARDLKVGMLLQTRFNPGVPAPTLNPAQITYGKMPHKGEIMFVKKRIRITPFRLLMAFEACLLLLLAAVVIGASISPK
ncbi:hypothetical protein [Streptomyces niveus]|uniref:hypothetical protein n=1 Tax=Streptomyces niveus TaxID=193462 RepID=UPI0034241FAE